MNRWKPLSAEQQAAYSIERQVLARSRIKLDFLDGLGPIAKAHGGKVSHTRMHLVPLVDPQEVIELQRNHSGLEMEKTAERIKKASFREMAQLGKYITVKLGEVGLRKLIDGKVILAAEVADDTVSIASERGMIASQLTRLVHAPVELEPRDPFLWLATVERQGDALGALIDFATDQLPDTTDLRDVTVFGAQFKHFAPQTEAI